MRSASIGALVSISLLAASGIPNASAADAPGRKPLSNDERAAVLALIHAVDVAQDTDAAGDEALAWSGHVLRSANLTGYVPFRIAMRGAGDGLKSAVVYVRAVTRHDGMRAKDERSVARDWLQRGTAPPPTLQTVFVGQGEMPIGGPAVGSSRTAVSGPAQASAALTLRQRELEREKAAEEAAKKKAESKARDPFVFPFEDFYVADVKASHGSESRVLERAIALPAGEFDVYVALLDHARLKTSGPLIVRHTVVVPDFWDNGLALSSLMLASEVNALPAAPSPQHQAERPYVFGNAEVVPVAASSFTQRDVLSVVFQICNYGAPDSDLAANYTFYRLDDGPRRLFNRTATQMLGDEDLPRSSAWETVAFVTQAVPLQPFPAGEYELEVSVRDRLTRRTATGTVTFTVR